MRLGGAAAEVDLAVDVGEGASSVDREGETGERGACVHLISNKHHYINYF